MVGMEQISGVYGQKAINYPQFSESAGQVVTTAEPGQKADSINISQQAKEVSKAVREKSEEQIKAEQERIEQARKSIEDGAYRVQQVILQVASRMTRLVPANETVDQGKVSVS